MTSRISLDPSTSVGSPRARKRRGHGFCALVLGLAACTGQKSDARAPTPPAVVVTPPTSLHDGGLAAAQATATTVSASAPAVVPQATPHEDPALALHRRSIVIDTHNDVTERLVQENIDLGARLPDGQTDIPRMLEGGLDAEFLSVWVAPRLFPGDEAYTQSLLEFDAIDRVVARHPNEVILARTVADVRDAAARGKIAFLIGVEGGHSLGKGTDQKLLARLKGFYDRGARYLTLTWASSNRLGGSSGDAGRNHGLTPFGKKVVARMNAMGMMVDVSHVSDRTFFDVVRLSKKPVIASHSSSRALADRPRNLTDDMLRAIAVNGGAVCVNFGPEFLDARWHVAFARAKKAARFNRAAFEKATGKDPAKAAIEGWKRVQAIARSVPPVPASRVIDHIEHIAKIAGVDHVCLGSDFDGVPTGLAGLEDVEHFPYITEELTRRGFKPEDVRKILGENVLRVMAENEQSSTRDR